MADGTFAVLTLIIGLTDMGLNYCGTEDACLGPSEVAPRLAFSFGEFDDVNANSDHEVFFRYDFGRRFGPFGQTIGISYADDGETWLGYGVTYLWQYEPLRGAYAELHTMPGIYFDNGGLDLGGVIQFRSGIEVGYENRNGWRYALSYDHRSNADIYSENPGVETYMFRLSIPLK